MLLIAIVIFLAAALGGLLMAMKIFSGSKPPMAIALVHGAAAATGLVLVILVWLHGGAGNALNAGLAILVVAALGGFFLFSLHLRNKPHPKAVVILHAGLAVAGVAALLLAFL